MRTVWRMYRSFCFFNAVTVSRKNGHYVAPSPKTSHRKEEQAPMSKERIDIRLGKNDETSGGSSKKASTPGTGLHTFNP